MISVSGLRSCFYIVTILLFSILAGCASSQEKTGEAAPPIIQEKQTDPGSVAPIKTKKALPSTPVAKPPAEGVPAEKESYFVHTVKWPGETVSIIAGWYTGNIENWKALAEANPEINPNSIRQGDRISIPERMMKTKTPMPRDYVDGFYPKSRPVKEPAKPAKEEEPVLFGPK
jgi:hypothetical protein